MLIVGQLKARLEQFGFDDVCEGGCEKRNISVIIRPQKIFAPARLSGENETLKSRESKYFKIRRKARKF